MEHMEEMKQEMKDAIKDAFHDQIIRGWSVNQLLDIFKEAVVEAIKELQEEN